MITLTENVGATRSALRTCAPEGALAGAAGGVLIGAAESAWCASRTASLDDIGLLWWGPVAYGVLFTFCGLGLGCVAAFLHGALNRFRQRSVSFAFSLGGTFAAGVVTVGRWRFYADFRRGLEATLPEKALIWLVAALTAAVVWFAVSRACALTLSRMRIRQGAVLAALMGLAVLIILGGTAAATFQGHSVVPAPYHRAMDLSSPNFILIIADALRADFLKLYDLNAEAKTPFLDALAGDGILFTSCFAQGSWTKPAFGTMLTGLYPSTHTATSQFAALPEDIITLAEQLSDHAFYTCALANNANVSSCMNFDQGFVEFYDPRRSRFHFGAPPSAAQLVLYDRVARELYRRLVSSKINIHNFYQPADAITDAALGWLDSETRPRNAPFHLMLHYMDPHDPYMGGRTRGEGYAKRYLGYHIPLRYRNSMVKAYIGDIEYMDRHLGRLFDGLRARHLYDGSLIVFTADHGEEFLDHKSWFHGNTLYDELIAVPQIIKLPNNLAKGNVNACMARHIDLAPTVLRLLGIPPPDSMGGQSLLAVDGTFLNEDIECAFSETDYRGNCLKSVRTINKKFIHVAKDPRGRFDPVECYDLSVDPCETTNRAGSGDLGQRILQDRLDQFSTLAAGRTAIPGSAEEISAELIEQLKSLGYVR